MESRWFRLDCLRLNIKIVDIKSTKILFLTTQDWLLLKLSNGQLSKEKTDRWWSRHQKISQKDQNIRKLTSPWSISKTWVMKVLSNSVIHHKRCKLFSIPDLHGLGSSLRIVAKREFALPKTKNSSSLNLIPSKWTLKVDRCFNMEEVLSWAIHLKTKAAFHLILKVACLNSTSSLLSKEKILKAYRDQASLDLLQLLLKVMRWISQWRMVLPALLPNSKLTLTSTKNSINSLVFIFLTMVVHLVISLLEAMTLKSMLRKVRK